MSEIEEIIKKEKHDEEIREKEEKEHQPVKDYIEGRKKCKSASEIAINNHNKRIQHLNVLLETRILRYKSLEAEIKMLTAEVSKHNDCINTISGLQFLPVDKVDPEEYKNEGD